jgi:hypothetical protein
MENVGKFDDLWKYFMGNTWSLGTFLGCSSEKIWQPCLPPTPKKHDNAATGLSEPLFPAIFCFTESRATAKRFYKCTSLVSQTWREKVIL